MDANLHQPLNAEALRVITGMERSEFVALTSRIVSGDLPPTIKLTTFFERVISAGASEEYSAALSSQLVAISIQRRANNVSVEKVLGAILKSMEVNGLAESEVNWFSDVKTEFLGLLNLESIRFVSKALHLSTESDNLFRRANIVTDVRPIFSGDRANVVGSMVVQLLRIRFLGPQMGGSENEISLSLDLDDLLKLKIEIENAIKKSESAKEFLSTQLGENCFVVGEETYAYE